MFEIKTYSYPYFSVNGALPPLNQRMSFKQPLEADDDWLLINAAGTAAKIQALSVTGTTGELSCNVI